MSTGETALAVLLGCGNYARLVELSNDPAVGAAHREHTAKLDGWTETVNFVGLAAGSVEIMACDTCGYFRVYCEHTRCSWNVAGTRLTCDLCGVDGT